MADWWIQSGTEEVKKSGFDNVLNWIKTHRETFIGSIVILLGAGIFAVFFTMKYQEIKETAWQNLFMAQQMAYAGRVEESVQRLNSIETDFAKTSAPPFAAFTKGDLYFKQGKLKEAIEEYQKIANNPKYPELAPFALYNAGRAKQALGDANSAAAVYRQLLEKYPEHFFAPEAHFLLAGILEKTNPEEAKKVYEKIALLYPENVWSASAQQKLAPPVERAAATSAPADRGKPAPDRPETIPPPKTP